MARLRLSGFGPFEEAELEVKPLTILVGRNSSGKSMLAYLVWSAVAAQPDYDVWARLTYERGAPELSEKILAKVRRGITPLEELKKLIAVELDSLAFALEPTLRELLEKVFAAELRELVHMGKGSAELVVEGERGVRIGFKVEADGVKATVNTVDLSFVESLKAKVRVEAGVPRLVVEAEGRKLCDEVVDSLAGIVKASACIVAYYVTSRLAPFFAGGELGVLFPDSRAGLSRVLLKPYVRPSLVRRAPYPDEHFVEAFFRLAELVAEDNVDLEPAKPLLDELGCSLEPVYEAGAYTVYVKTWTGQRIPLARAPSGIREAAAVVAALTSRGAPYFIVIEEPEAHLHPKAQWRLAELIAWAVNKGKTVLLTTHSDTLLSALNNLIMASRLSSEELKRLGMSRERTLKPEMVAAYLVRPDPSRKASVVERLKVDGEGIPEEEEFARVAEELAQQRALILA